MVSNKQPSASSAQAPKDNFAEQMRRGDFGPGLQKLAGGNLLEPALRGEMGPEFQQFAQDYMNAATLLSDGRSFNLTNADNLKAVQAVFAKMPPEQKEKLIRASRIAALLEDMARTSEAQSGKSRGPAK